MSWVQSINPVFIIVLRRRVRGAVDQARRPAAGDARSSSGSGHVLDGGGVLRRSCSMPGGAQHARRCSLLASASCWSSPSPSCSSPRSACRCRPSSRPTRFHTQMVALYFLSIALGTALAGTLARLLRPGDRDGLLPAPRRDRRRGWRAGAGVRQADRRLDGRRALSRREGGTPRTEPAAGARWFLDAEQDQAARARDSPCSANWCPGLLELVATDERERGEDADGGDDGADEGEAAEKPSTSAVRGVTPRPSRVGRARGRDRGERGDAERPADLLRRVEQPGRKARLGRLDAGERGDRDRHEGEADARRRRAGTPAAGRQRTSRRPRPA